MIEVAHSVNDNDVSVFKMFNKSVKICQRNSATLIAAALEVKKRVLRSVIQSKGGYDCKERHKVGKGAKKDN